MIITRWNSRGGVAVQSFNDQRSAQAGLLENLNAQEQSVVGVDINEELLHLMDFQRMVQGASRFMSVVNSALDCLSGGTNCGSFKPPATWSGIRGAMTWSINWDVSNGNGFANTVKPHLNSLP